LTINAGTKVSAVSKHVKEPMSATMPTLRIAG
jgi:hypothetical protein